MVTCRATPSPQSKHQLPAGPQSKQGCTSSQGHRKSTAPSGAACGSEVCPAALGSSPGWGWSGMGFPNCTAHWGNKWQKQCPSGFFSFSPHYRVTVHVTLWCWVIYHHWVPRLALLEKNQRKQQGPGFDEEETNSSLQKHANFSATPCTPTHSIPGCSFPLPAAPFSLTHPCSSPFSLLGSSALFLWISVSTPSRIFTGMDTFTGLLTFWKQVVLL